MQVHARPGQTESQVDASLEFGLLATLFNTTNCHILKSQPVLSFTIMLRCLNGHSASCIENGLHVNRSRIISSFYTVVVRVKVMFIITI